VDLKSLQKQIKGQVFAKSSQDFNATRDNMVWNNIKPERSPDIIVTVADDQDVIASVNFARENGLKVVMHGGGHTWCGLAVRNGGMTIDLSRLNESQIADGKAVIQPVISNRELARRLGEHNLAFPIGHCPTVKAGGYLLNGGMSWNMSQWGPACLNVEAVDFVTADGKMIQASARENSDLFWASKGAGPGMFAVATKFHLHCYPLPQAIMTSNYYYHLSDLEQVVEEVVSLGWKMPDFVELSIFLIQLAQKKVCMITAVAFGKTKEESISALSLLEKVNTKCLAKQINEPSNFDKLAEVSGITWPEKHRNLCENQCSNASPVDILMALREKFLEAPSEKSVIVFCQSTGGHKLLEAKADMALSMDGSSYGGIWSIWEHEKDDTKNRQWHKECTEILKKFTNQHYIGETDIVEDPKRVQNSYSLENWKRLEQIRKKYDPTNLFFSFFGGL